MPAKKDHSFALAKGIALDIDDTLSNTLYRLVRQMRALFGNPENLTTAEIIKKYHIIDYIPYWQTAEIIAWIKKTVDSDDANKDFPLMENAQRMVAKIDKSVNISCYLTLRRQEVISGTARWLKKHGFPDKPIICRPNDMEYNDGHDWKAKVLMANPSLLGLIDDNAKIIKHLSDDYAGTIFLFRHKEYKNDSKIKIIPCKNWFVTLKEVKKNFTSPRPPLRP
ncbi:MAG: hypothetical protein AAB390_03440 [Patescibacteria group bacterium]